MEFSAAGFDVGKLRFQKRTIIELHVAQKHATKRTIYESAIGIYYIIHGRVEAEVLVSDIGFLSLKSVHFY